MPRDRETETLNNRAIITAMHTDNVMALWYLEGKTARLWRNLPTLPVNKRVTRIIYHFKAIDIASALILVNADFADMLGPLREHMHFIGL